MIKTYRYLVFAGGDLYPSGGWGDLCGRANSLAEAKAEAAEKGKEDWYHIVDLETGEIVLCGHPAELQGEP